MSNNTAVDKDILEKLKDYGVSIALLGYAAGFVVTSIYLGQYGVANFDIVRAHYVLSGIMFLLFSYTCLHPAYVAWNAVDKIMNISIKEMLLILWESFIANIIAVAAISIPLYAIAFLLRSPSIPTRFSLLSVGIYLLSAMIELLLYLFVYIAIRLPVKIRNLIFDVNERSQEDEARDAVYNKKFLLFFSSSAILFLFLTMVLCYSLWVYPTLPLQLGGGQEIPVEVTFKLDHTVQTLNMLDRTSTTIIFQEENCANHAKRVVEVASDEIFAISQSDQPMCPQSTPPAEPTQPVYPQSTPTLEYDFSPLVTPTGSAQPGGQGRH